jgi:outer membrane lipoprotein SlyB
LVDEGIPIVSGVAGSTIGAATGNPLLGMAAGYAGKQLGKEAARRIRKSQGRGLTDLAMEVGKRVAKKVAKKVISYGAKKARLSKRRDGSFG